MAGLVLTRCADLTVRWQSGALPAVPGHGRQIASSRGGGEQSSSLPPSLLSRPLPSLLPPRREGARLVLWWERKRGAAGDLIFSSRFITPLFLEDALKPRTLLLGVGLLEHLGGGGEVSLQQPCLKVVLFSVWSLLVSMGLGCKWMMLMGFWLLALLLLPVCVHGVGSTTLRWFRRQGRAAGCGWDSWVQY